MSRLPLNHTSNSSNRSLLHIGTAATPVVTSAVDKKLYTNNRFLKAMILIIVLYITFNLLWGDPIQTTTMNTGNMVTTTSSYYLFPSLLSAITSSSTAFMYDENDTNNGATGIIRSGRIMYIPYYSCHRNRNTNATTTITSTTTTTGKDNTFGSRRATDKNNNPAENSSFVTIEETTSTENMNTNIKAKQYRYNLILLHDEIHNNEDWKTSGILNQFCNIRTANNNNSHNKKKYHDMDYNKYDSFDLTVFALDLSINANHNQLKDILMAIQHQQKQNHSRLQQQKQHQDLQSKTQLLLNEEEQQQENTAPKNSNQNKKEEGIMNVLITPSSSQRIIIDWMKNGNIIELLNMINIWIPVSGIESINEVTNDQVQSLATTTTANTRKTTPRINNPEKNPKTSSLSLSSKNLLSIYAIYGNQDELGEMTSDRLEILANAKSLVLPGTSTIYLDSPIAFVNSVLEYLSEYNSKTE